MTVNHFYHRPEPIAARSGCPSKIFPHLEVHEKEEGQRELIYRIAAANIVHKSKGNVVKNSLDLGKIHQELEINSLIVQGSGASNVLLAKISFLCLIKIHGSDDQRAPIVFDLKIPRGGAKEEFIFSYDEAVRWYKEKKGNLYGLLSYSYREGKALVNPLSEKHGHVPGYDATTSKHDQYIRHTEQMLVAYLARPEGARMVVNRLRTTIRSQFTGATDVKVYSMGLHLHSTKTCCAPCEYVLLNLMNDQVGLLQGKTRLSFLRNFITACAEPNGTLNLTLPQRAPFRIITTVGATGGDAHHQTTPTYTKKQVKVDRSNYGQSIFIKGPNASHTIVTFMLEPHYDRRRLPAVSSLTDSSVLISGSSQSPGTPGSRNKVAQERKTFDQVLSPIRSMSDS